MVYQYAIDNIVGFKAQSHASGTKCSATCSYHQIF